MNRKDAYAIQPHPKFYQASMDSRLSFRPEQVVQPVELMTSLYRLSCRMFDRDCRLHWEDYQSLHRFRSKVVDALAVAGNLKIREVERNKQNRLMVCFWSDVRHRHLFIFYVQIEHFFDGTMATAPQGSVDPSLNTNLRDYGLVHHEANEFVDVDMECPFEEIVRPFGLTSDDFCHHLELESLNVTDQLYLRDTEKRLAMEAGSRLQAAKRE